MLCGVLFAVTAAFATEADYVRSYARQPSVVADARARPDVKNGTWYLDGAPVFWLGGWIHGVSTADWPEGDPDRQKIGHVAYTTPPGKVLFDAIGFNSSQISHAPVQAGRGLMGLPLAQKDPARPWVRDWRAIEARDAAFIRRFEDMPMAVDFAYGFAAEVPDPVRKAADQVNPFWHLFIPFCPESRDGDRYYTSYFLGGTRTLMRYGMNVFLYELFNESSYACACRMNREDFAVRMKRKYRTIGRANETWGTAFASFGDVAARADLKPCKGAYHDWCDFLGTRYVEILERYKAVIRSADGRDRVYFTEQCASEPPHRPGIDYRKVAETLGVMTLEGGWRYGDSAVANTGGRKPRHLFTLDFYRALARDRKPIMNHEAYCGRFERGMRVPSRREDFITSLWVETMHGVSGAFFYNFDKRAYDWNTFAEAKANVTNDSYKSYSLLNPYAMPPEHLDAFRRFREELEPYSGKLLPMPRVKPATVAVLFSYPTLWRAKAVWYGNEAVDATGDWYERLLHAQIPVKVVFDEDVAALGNEVEWLVLPAASRCADATVAAMRRFTARGGRIAAAPGALRRTVYEKPRPETSLPPMTTVADSAACVHALLNGGVTRWAALKPADGGGAFEKADVQICDRGDFKLVCLVNFAPGGPRRATLSLNLGAGTFDMKDLATGMTQTVDLAKPVKLTLPAQTRVVLAFEKRSVAEGNSEEGS